MAISQHKHELLIEISLMLSALVFVPILLLLQPFARFHEGTQVHLWCKVFWWTCMVLMAWICIIKTKGNFIGSLLCIFFGPISLLALGFYWLGRRWVFKT